MFFRPGLNILIFWRFQAENIQHIQKWKYTNVPRNLCRWNLHILPLISHQATKKPNFLIPAWDQKSFFCHPNSIFYRHGRLYHLWSPSCFCQINLEKFCRMFQELRFCSHMRSSWDLPFNNKNYYMATIVRAVQLAAERAIFPFNDRALLALCPRHIQSVFDLIVDIHVMVNWQLSKKVFADQNHMTVSRAQVYNPLKWRVFLKLSADQLMVLIDCKFNNFQCFILIALKR